MDKPFANLNTEITPYDPLENKKWGFTRFSEKINGRAAMLGFMILFLFELVTKQKIMNL